MIRSVYQIKDDSRDVLAQMLDLFRVNYGISIAAIAKEIEVKPWVLYDARYLTRLPKIEKAAKPAPADEPAPGDTAP